MKKVIVVVLLFFVMALLVIPRVVRAGADFNLGNFYLGEDEIHGDNLVGVGTSFNIKGKIDGDLIVVAHSVVVSGEITGDVIAGANTVKIEGEVKGNVRVVASSIEINGKIVKNVNLAAETITFGPGSGVLGTIGFLSRKFEFRGMAEKKIRGWSYYALIGGKLKNDLEVDFFDEEKKAQPSGLEIIKNASIAGNIVYGSLARAKLAEGAEIQGNLTKRAPKVWQWEWHKKTINSFWRFVKVVNLFGILIVGMIIVTIWKKSSLAIAEKMRTSVGKSFLWGLLILIVVPIVAFLLLFTVIGIPIALIGIVLYIIAIYISTVFVGLAIGRLILKFSATKNPSETKKTKEPSLFWSMVLGVVIYVLATSFLLTGIWGGGAWTALGFIGGVIKFFAVCWALGAILLIKRQRVKEEE